MRDIIKKIEDAGLIGRGGAEFSTALKWNAVKKAKGETKHVICNASEGEPGCFKDFYILENHTDKVFEGLVLAMDFLNTKESYIYIRKDYFKKLKKQLNAQIKKYKRDGYTFHIFEENPSYIGGEETALLNALEGERVTPRLKPPYPSDAGLFGFPTIIQNVETLYDIALVAKGEYQNNRFYSLTVDGHKKGVYELSKDLSIKKVLEETGNIPEFEYFVQIGGSASGLVLSEKQLSRQKMIGAGSIEVYRLNTEPNELLSKWFKFYSKESCGLCGPCRMGSFNLELMLEGKKKISWPAILEVVDAMEKTSFCALGRSVAVPVKSYLKNVLNLKVSKK